MLLLLLSNKLVADLIDTYNFAQFKDDTYEIIMLGLIFYYSTIK